MKLQKRINTKFYKNINITEFIPAVPKWQHFYWYIYNSWIE